MMHGQKNIRIFVSSNRKDRGRCRLCGASFCGTCIAWRLQDFVLWKETDIWVRKERPSFLAYCLNRSTH